MFVSTQIGPRDKKISFLFYLRKASKCFDSFDTVGSDFFVRISYFIILYIATNSVTCNNFLFSLTVLINCLTLYLHNNNNNNLYLQM